jgi:hypothetical protein
MLVRMPQGKIEVDVVFSDVLATLYVKLIDLIPT